MTPFSEPLTPEEEQNCLERYRAGDEEAKAELTLHNMRLVAHIAKKYAGPERDLEELISVGTVGLIKAVQTFRPDKGSKLSTYIARCVQNAILAQKKLSAQDPEIRQKKTCEMPKNQFRWEMSWEKMKTQKSRKVF